MKYIFITAIALSLSGCATFQNSSMCKNVVAIRAALDIAMTQTDLIVDPVKREIARSAINISYAELSKCPSI